MDESLKPVGKILYLHEVGRILWTIGNYCDLCKDKVQTFYFISPTFEKLGATWYFRLYPCDIAEYEDHECVSIYLHQKNFVEIHSVFYKVEMKARGTVLESFSGETCLSQGGTKEIKIYNFLDNLSLSNLRQKDYLAIFLTLYATDPSTIKTAHLLPSLYLNTSEGVDLLSSEIEKLYLEGQDCDFKIRVKSKEFSVHKVILAARSPILYSMLHHDMAEKNTGIVDIVDFEPDVFNDFLLYVYSGRVKGLSWRNVTKLFSLGDKYDMQYLKKKCREYMLDMMCVDGFCDVVELAMKHEEPVLLKCAERFFKKNIKSILVTKQWQEYMDRNSTVCNELLIKFVSSLSSEKNS